MFENDLTIMIVRLITAAILGGLIGVEREFHHHPAGFRTHLLVSVGSCLIMLLAFYGFEEYIIENKNVVTFDPSRLASYVVSGIGFLGAGTILVQGYTVRGLTTAASIWVVAAIGLTVGAGMYEPAIITTCLVILSLFLLGKAPFRFGGEQDPKYQLIILTEGKYVKLNELMRTIEGHEIKLKGRISEKKKSSEYEKSLIEYRFLVEYKEGASLNNMTEELHHFDFIHRITIKCE
jgi:putative Mg2+ transporter-C (MgtC) family protein